MLYTVHTDGGARGNPGPAAVGVVIEEGEAGKGEGEKKLKIIAEFGKRIGATTNNVAEYTAVIEALTYMKLNHESGIMNYDKNNIRVQFYLDSTLVVNQINGLFKVKDAKLRELLTRVRILEQETVADIRYSVIPREQNTRADFFVNQALDGLAGSK